MADDITEGKMTQTKGKAREDSGKLTGNKSQEIQGIAEQVAGKLQEQFGEAKKYIKNTMEE